MNPRNRDSSGLEVFLKDNDEIKERYSMLIEHDNVRLGLIKKNGKLHNLQKFRVKT
ncbi:hypothetical protein JCM30760_04280 [Thiomicrorhabdus hydrogeniphila]